MAYTFADVIDTIKANATKDMLIDIYWLKRFYDMGQEELDKWFGEKGINKAEILKGHLEGALAKQESIGNLHEILKEFMSNSPIDELKIFKDAQVFINKANAVAVVEEMKKARKGKKHAEE